jgi:tetratricopeptide (TPR) repeat protein
MYIADYLFSGIDRRDRAVEIMLDAYRRKLLDDSQQVHMVNRLQEADRYAESVPVLETYLKRFPLQLSQRCQLMIAYFHTKQPEVLARLLKQTHDLFHLENRWNENVMWQLGDTCRTCELFEPAVEYLKEAIAAHATSRTGKPCKFADVVLSQYMGDDQLSTYYQSLARSYAGLKNTTQAVDAASSSIVVWTRRQGQRQAALETLREVLQNSPDLNAYVKVLDKETKDSGQDRPIVRKILGEVFQAKSQFKEAIAQYQAAVQLSPGDAELHAKLIECFDALEDNAGAIAQSFDSLELNRRNFDLWQKLGERLQTAMQPEEAERARTSLAEVAPGETEGLVKLAETRETQKRLTEALEQWQQVGQIRKLEPTGLLNAARLQLELKQKEAAAESLKQLETTTWPERFKDELQQKLPGLRTGLQK